MLVLALACFLPTTSGDSKKNNQNGDDTGAPSGDGWSDLGVSVETASGTTARNGKVEIPLELSGGVMLATAIRPDGGLLAVEYLDDASGNRLLDWEEWSSSANSLTDAIYVYDDSTNLNWPVREEDGVLAPGSYTLTIGAVDSRYNYEAGVDVELTLFHRSDSDFSKGNLKVLIVEDNDIEQDAELHASIVGALDYWVELYGRYGVTMTYREQFVNLEANLPSPGWGDDLYASLADNAEPGEVVVVVGEIISGDKWLYGEAGGIPGALVSTKRSVVAASWLTCAGSDGVYSEDDILFLGETIAHEVGHYLGMYHPVESDYQYWDALEDTPECTSWQICESAMADNLMFPYPICDRDGVCDRQDVLSGDQKGVVQRYLGVVEE